MPRTMAGLDASFFREVNSALKLAISAETALVQIGRGSRAYHRSMHPTRIEYLYELAFLKMFISWEDFLEQSFLRYMCGHLSARWGKATMKGGKAYCPDLKTANGDMLAAMNPKKPWDYIRWGSTKIALDAAKAVLTNSRHQILISAEKTTLDHFGAIRNRIAHGQLDAITKFEATAMHFAKRRFDGRAGRFLRDFDRTGGRYMPWIMSIGISLKAYASKIV
jgi:hypothetical protein